MAKKQTRRSISVSRTTYERLKAFCETNHISMSQLVETRVNDFLGAGDIAPMPSASSAPPRPPAPPRPMLVPLAKPVESRPVQPSASMGASTGTSAGTGPSPVPAAIPAQPAPITSAAARFVVEPPPPIIKPRQDTAAPKPAEKRPEQIFTF